MQQLKVGSFVVVFNLQLRCGCKETVLRQTTTLQQITPSGFSSYPILHHFVVIHALYTDISGIINYKRFWHLP